MKIENWCGHEIRFIEIDGEWWAVLKDICDALKLRTAAIAQRLNPDMLEKVKVQLFDADTSVVSSELRSFEMTSIVHEPVKEINKARIGNDIHRKRGAKSQWMYVINEIGIYEALFASRKLEARKFRLWAAGVMSKLRKNVGLEGYEVMRMTEPEIQADIDFILDSLYWDDERKCVMRSVTVQGGDVEQVPFE